MSDLFFYGGGLFFYGGATDTQYTAGGNGVSHHLHGQGERESYRVNLELCGTCVATAYAVVDDFGDLVPVRARLDYFIGSAA